MPILSLPWDVFSHVANYLDIRAYTCLSKSNQRFYKDLQDEGSARKCIQVSSHVRPLSPFSTDPQQQYLANSDDGRCNFVKARHHGFRKRLADVYDKHEALRTAQPYSASVVAYATSFVYEQGILCYSTVDSIRILNLRMGGGVEKIISARFFSSRVMELAEPASSRSVSTRSMSVLSYSDDILTVLCDFGPTKGCYLFAVDIADGKDRKRCLLKVRLHSTEQIFARHNKSYLYYGTLTARGSYGHREWLIQGYNLSTGQKTSDPTQLYNFAGADLGSSVAFTIHDGRFYAVSNQAAHESEEVNWTSYFHYISFPLGEKDPKVEIKTIYRRQDNDGPIHDAWTDLGFQIDHETGELLIIECRKEWFGGSSSCIRTYYVQPWDRACHDDWDGENTVDPSDPVRHTLTEKDRARFERAPHPPVPKYTHPEFSESYSGEKKEYLRAKTKWNGYDFNNQCYVDLVVDEVEEEGSWRKKERLRLRVVSRLPGSPIYWAGDPEQEGKGKLEYMVRETFQDKLGEQVRDSDVVFQKSEVFLWPREGKEVPKELNEILCPGGKAGEVKAKIGEEGLVYLAGPAGQFGDGAGGERGERALVFLGFEPGWGWEGMKKLDGSVARPRATKAESKGEDDSGSKRKVSMKHEQRGGEAKKQRSQVAEERPAEMALMAQVASSGADAKSIISVPRSVAMDGKTEAGSHSTATATSATAPGGTATTPRERLLWMEKAKYLGISRGYWLR